MNSTLWFTIMIFGENIHLCWIYFYGVTRAVLGHSSLASVPARRSASWAETADPHFNTVFCFRNCRVVKIAQINDTNTTLQGLGVRAGLN